MGYEKAGDIVRDAYENGYAVAAFNVFNYETVKWAVKAAEQAGRPAIIEFYPGLKEYIPLEAVASITRLLAEKARVPVGLHLDHSNSYDEIMLAIRSGFLSVMYDGSLLPYEENLSITGKVVKAAKASGVDVEAELGHVGSAGRVEDFTDRDKFTNPRLAKEFAETTGISSLAISIGNAHGNYVRLPELDIDRLGDINLRLGIPLVLHGGSGIPDLQVKKAVRSGVAKMNVATDYLQACYRAVNNYIDTNTGRNLLACMEGSEKETIEFLISKINLLHDKSTD